MALSNEDPSTIKQQEEGVLELIEGNPHIFAQFERLLNLLLDLNIIAPLNKHSSKINNCNDNKPVNIEGFSNLPLEPPSLLVSSETSLKQLSSDMHNLETGENLGLQNNLASNLDKQPHHLLNDEKESPKQLSPDVPILEQAVNLETRSFTQQNIDGEPQFPHLQPEASPNQLIQQNTHTLEETAEPSANYSIQDAEILEKPAETSPNHLIQQNKQTLEETAEPSPNYSMQDAETLEETAQPSSTYSIQDAETLKKTAETSPNYSMQDAEILKKTAEPSSNQSIQNIEILKETAEASSNQSIQNAEILEETAEASPNYSVQNVETLEQTAEPSSNQSIQNTEFLEETPEVFPNQAIQDTEILYEAVSSPNGSIQNAENLALTQDLNTNISQNEILASELHRLLNAEKESANPQNQNEHNLEQTEDINTSIFQPENLAKQSVNIQQDSTLISEDKFAHIEHIINEAIPKKSYEVTLCSIEDKITNIEHRLYEPTELINIIMPAIADIINRQLADSKEEIVGAIAPIIDASIHNKINQDSDAMREAITSTLLMAISRQMHDYHQEIAATITKQINLEREAIANALIPIIENTIAKHMANSERAFSFNKAIGNIGAKLQRLKVPSHTQAVPSPRQKRPSLRIAGLFFLSLIFLPLGFVWYRNGIERRIEETTTKALESAPELSMYRIGVDANNGILRLSGKVPNQNLRQKAGQIANKVAGGLKLDNDIITVKAPVDPAVTAAEVKRVISILNQSSGVAIKAKYTAGKVTVEGTVDQDADIKNIAQAIKQIPGVKSVSNNLKLEPNAIAQRIYFAPGSAKLNRSDIKSKIILIKSFMEQYPQENIRIIGNTDANSNQTKYQWLALKRAESVRDALVNQGVDTKRLQVTTRTNRPKGVDANQPAWLSRSVEFEAIAPTVKTKQSSGK